MFEGTGWHVTCRGREGGGGGGGEREEVALLTPLINHITVVCNYDDTSNSGLSK